MIQKLPKSANDLINCYLNLKLGSKNVPTPYFMNESKKFRHRAFAGKGTPEEIENAVVKAANASDFNLQKSSVKEIREFMLRKGIGIDCSGLVVWILNEMAKEKTGKPIWKSIDFTSDNLFKKLIKNIRPVENISVRVLSNPRNSREINLSEIQPGDLIITRSGGHVLLITKIEYNKNMRPLSFEYVNSNAGYEDESGVRRGEVKITDPSDSLLDQKWLDFYKGRNWVYEGLMENPVSVKIIRMSGF